MTGRWYPALMILGISLSLTGLAYSTTGQQPDYATALDAFGLAGCSLCLIWWRNQR